MNIKEYCKSIERTRANLKYKEKDNLHMIMGMVTEVGELTDVFKKDLAYHKKIDWANVSEEIGDLLWYICNFCNVNHIDIEKVMDVNIEKLKIRYPDKFTESDAINRNLEEERKILEQ